MPDSQDQTPSAVQTLKASILAKLRYSVGRDPSTACPHDWFEAVALAVRDHIIDHWEEATPQGEAPARKRVYYLSLEFLIGRLLLDNLGNLGLLEETRQALAELGVDLQRIVALEPDAALGNGGLGRLAACFMESMASLDIPAHGYGIRYEHGLFRQVLTDGWQQEQTETWLDFGNPWEFERPEVSYYIDFGGSVQVDSEHSGRAIWRPDERIRAIAYDTPIVGWRRASVNTLRLWRARAEEDLQLTVSTPATISARWSTWSRRRASRGCCIRQTAPRPVRNCACARSTSSSQPRCRTCSTATCAIITTCVACRNRWRSSSTTPTRRSPSPS